MAKKAKRVIGVEVVAPAIEDAHKNAERNGIVNAEFLCADAAEAAAKLEARGERPDVIIVDPVSYTHLNKAAKNERMFPIIINPSASHSFGAGYRPGQSDSSDGYPAAAPGPQRLSNSFLT